MYQQDIPLNIKAKNCPYTVQLVFNHYFLLFPLLFFFFCLVVGGGGVIFCVLLSFFIIIGDSNKNAKSLYAKLFLYGVKFVLARNYKNYLTWSYFSFLCMISLHDHIQKHTFSHAVLIYLKLCNIWFTIECQIQFEPAMQNGFFKAYAARNGLDQPIFTCSLIRALLLVYKRTALALMRPYIRAHIF